MLLSVALYTAVAGAQVNIPDESPIIRIDLNTTADLEADASATIINIDDALDGPLVATACVPDYHSPSPFAVVTSNQYMHIGDFPTPETNTIMAVNVDVLYSFSILHLSETDVLLGIPEFVDSYWSYFIWDFNANGNAAGTYRLKRDALNEMGIENGSIINITTALPQTIVPSFDTLITTNFTDPQTVLQFAASLNGYTAKPTVDILSAASIEADFADPAHVVQLGSNWTTASGIGYLHTQKFTLLPNHPMLGGTIDFSTRSVKIAFFGKPGVISLGLWDIGSYDALRRLVPNRIDRYSIGSKTSNLQYLAGGQVYGSDTADGQDGTFQILLHSADMSPPANWTGNWVPAANSASHTLRMYWPESSLTNECYVWPEIESLSPITT
ncbi:hypothetical protein CcaCcLH18_11649 [Colletotrichum camelliae]|nr:hypothetical protein CcaCcLH18_11649 [Colletotrichum camelliae]